MRFYFETYGCTTNRADTDVMKGLVEQSCHSIVEDVGSADVAVLNTCIVIGKTENRMFRRIKELSEEDLDLVVSGCLSATSKEKIKEIDEDITVLYPDESGQITKILDREPVHKSEAPHSLDGVVGRVQIAEGCLGNCSYCITKMARGSLNSFSIDSIVSKVKDLVSRGGREIRLTAQDTGVYGNDIGSNLTELLKVVAKVPGDFRVRVGMMNPMMSLDLFEDVLDVMDDERFYSFIHLPVQSGSEKVLEKMRRGYSPEKFVRMAGMARDRLDATLSTDVVVGFPGEGVKEFQMSVDVLEEVGPDIINITRFSSRPGTDAEDMDAPASNPVKERSKMLTDLRNRVCGSIREGMVGDRRSVTVIEKGKPGSVIARDEFYNPVVLKEDFSLGESFEVEIVEGKWSYLVGEIRDSDQG